jgi:hypothetical protein
MINIRNSSQTVLWEDRPHQTNHRTPHHTTIHPFVKANGCPYSKLTPEDGQRTPETCTVAKIKKTKQSDIKLVTYRYCNTMHGTRNLKLKNVPIISGYLARVCGRIWQAFAVSPEPQTRTCSTALILLYYPTRRKKTTPSGVSVAC